MRSSGNRPVVPVTTGRAVAVRGLEESLRMFWVHELDHGEIGNVHQVLSISRLYLNTFDLTAVKVKIEASPQGFHGVDFFGVSLGDETILEVADGHAVGHAL